MFRSLRRGRHRLKQQGSGAEFIDQLKPYMVPQICMRSASDLRTEETLTLRGLGATSAACADGSGLGCAAGNFGSPPPEAWAGDPHPETLRGKGGGGGGCSPPH